MCATRTKSISEREIGLIKAMLARGQRNNEIQFYFNRPDRPVNSGRISGIRASKYGADVPPATNTELDEFLTDFAPANAEVVVDAEKRHETTLDEKALARFVQRESKWYLADGETSDQECKNNFDPNRLGQIVRAIAALANNRGGFVFIGVQDKTFQVIGMQDTLFQDTDIVRITDKVKTLLTPTPDFSKALIKVGGMTVGVLHVEKYPNPPVIVCKDSDGLQDGAILFRYPGQSGQIKFGDLLEMLRRRDQEANRALLASATRLSEIGVDRALIVDTAKGELDAGSKRIMIDRALADQLNFIREGEFDERTGAPALRLLGDVHAVDGDGKAAERVEERAIDAEAALLAYLERTTVRAPLEYIALAAKVRNSWLPLFYFVRLTGGKLESAISTLKDTKPVFSKSKENALKRLQGCLSAFKTPSGTITDVVAELQAGCIDNLRPRFTDTQIVSGIRGLPDDFEPSNNLFQLLGDIYRNADGNPNVRSGVFSAAARLDEIENKRVEKSR